MDEIEFQQNAKLITKELEQINSETTRTIIVRLIGMMQFLQEQITELQENMEGE
ncbi:MAG TPA: hypothetical protein VGN34_12860 [Ktedonobacteraceae bacterium]|jgi:hypothetical protein